MQIQSIAMSDEKEAVPRLDDYTNSKYTDTLFSLDAAVVAVVSVHQLRGGERRAPNVYEVDGAELRRNNGETGGIPLLHFPSLLEIPYRDTLEIPMGLTRWNDVCLRIMTPEKN